MNPIVKENEYVKAPKQILMQIHIKKETAQNNE